MKRQVTTAAVSVQPLPVDSPPLSGAGCPKGGAGCYGQGWSLLRLIVCATDGRGNIASHARKEITHPTPTPPLL